MNKLIHQTKSFLFARQSTIFSSAVIISAMIVLSRIFGFLRYRVMAGYFGENDLDIFFASFRIPDIVFEILITGALISSFIPIYVKYEKNKDELNVNISSIINALSLCMFVFILVLLLFMDPLMRLITPGFGPGKIEQIIYFSRLLLIGQLPFLVIGNFLTGIGQANKTFFLPSLAPVIYNVSIIIFTVLFANSMGLMGPILGVILGGICFFIIQLPILYTADYRYSLVLKKTKALIDFMRVIVPRTITIIVAQIDATIDLTLTTLLGTGAYTVFYFAQRLQLLPVSVIGVAFGQASLPYLSEIYEKGRPEDFRKLIADSILNLFFFTIPIASFFIFARTPLIRLFFGGEKFNWDATVTTAYTLSYFSIALPFHSIYYFLTRCFYAFLDSRTPFYVSLVSIVLNTTFSLLFIVVLHFPVWSLAISFSIAMIINVLLLMILLKRKVGFEARLVFVESMKMVVATVMASVVVYYLIRFMDGLVFDTTRTLNVLLLLLTGLTVYILIYLFICWFLDVREMYLISKLMFKAREYQRKIIELYAQYE